MLEYRGNEVYDLYANSRSLKNEGQVCKEEFRSSTAGFKGFSLIRPPFPPRG